MTSIKPGPYRVAVAQAVEFLITTNNSTLSSWTAATLTIRADPRWERIGSDKVTDIEGADLDSWGDPVLQLTNFDLVSGTAPYQYRFTATRAQMAAVPRGRRRCVIDVWRTDSGNEFPDVWPTWLLVVSPVYPEP